MSNFFESFIGFFSPDSALKRAQKRFALAELRSYEAAGKGRRTDSWRATANSANTENYSSIVTLRNRSRDMVRNNVYAKSAIDVISTNTIGTGILPNPKSADEKNLTNIKQAWRQWAETPMCDFNGRLNFYGLQEQVMRAVAESGESIILKRKVKTSICPLGIQLQVLESDFLDVNKTIATLDGINQKNPGGYIIQGIEFDSNGKRVAYWLYERHPGDYSFQPVRALVSRRVPESEVIHVFHQERPGQERGVPFGVSAMLRLRDFDDYEDAQLIRQKIAACFTVFIEDNVSDNFKVNSTTEDDKMIERVEPGIIEHVPSGKKVSFANPPTVQNYDEYSRKMLQGIAAGYGVSYEALTKDLSNVNFSSGRMGWLEFHRNVTKWQKNVIIPTLCDTVWKWFFFNGSLAGFFNDVSTDISWTTPRREMIDPVKETTGITNQVRAGILTPSGAARQQGYEFSELMKEYSDDLKLVDKYGIILDTDMRFQTKQTVDAPEPGA